MNVYEKYNVKQVINASGKMTILGGSRVEDDVCQQMNVGATHFFEVKELLNQTGDYLAKLIGVESTYIVNSASGGIAQSVASCISQGQLKYILNLFDVNLTKREIVICKGHNVDYGTPIEVTIGLGGGKIVEAGYANKCTLEHVESCINENTAALIYVKSHHCVQKGMPDMKAFIELGHQYHLPVIVDAAAEEDLKKYYDYDADVVIYSGTKAIEGPTAGLMVGKKVFIDQVKLQSQGIGRVMKVGKENIIGLTYAIEKYLHKNHLSLEEQAKRLDGFHQRLNDILGLSAKCVQDGAGRLIMRSEITFDENVLNVNALKVSELLKHGDIQIYTRDYRANEGKIEIDIRDVTDSELEVILTQIIRIIKGEQ
ncbi:MAG: DgaE family pyridoxal phosphate-dependent ammonia lyase [Coprobacillus sp.]